MKHSIEIIALITAQGSSDARDVKAVLEDGAALAALGITDEDQEGVEEAHDTVTRSIAVALSKEKAKETVNRLDAWKNARPGRQVAVNWRWFGRDRSGVVALVQDGDIINSMEFMRGTSNWSENDRDFTRCHTGSRKHKALLAVAHNLGA